MAACTTRCHAKPTAAVKPSLAVSLCTKSHMGRVDVRIASPTAATDCIICATFSGALSRISSTPPACGKCGSEQEAALQRGRGASQILQQKGAKNSGAPGWTRRARLSFLLRQRCRTAAYLAPEPAMGRTHLDKFSCLRSSCNKSAGLFYGSGGGKLTLRRRGRRGRRRGRGGEGRRKGGRRECRGLAGA